MLPNPDLITGLPSTSLLCCRYPSLLEGIGSNLTIDEICLRNLRFLAQPECGRSLWSISAFTRRKSANVIKKLRFQQTRGISYVADQVFVSYERLSHEISYLVNYSPSKLSFLHVTDKAKWGLRPLESHFFWEKTELKFSMSDRNGDVQVYILQYTVLHKPNFKILFR